MAIIDPEVLNPILLEGLTGKITWLEASKHFELDDLIDTFYATRERVENAIEPVTDAQAVFTSPVHPMWSISESITHLIYSQGFYLNTMLDIATSQLPHVVEAARGQGEGAKTGVPADQLRLRLAAATEQIHTAIEGTRSNHDATKNQHNSLFGICDYRTWILLLLGHEVDHLRQIIAMRRLARAEKI